MFTILGSALKQIVISVETVPTEQGLGVKLSNNADGIGCVVKTIADASTAKGILQSGDRSVMNTIIIAMYSHHLTLY